MWYFFVFQFPIAVPYGGSGSALDRFYLFSWFAGFTRFSLMSSSSILAGTRYICIYINKLTRDEPRKQQHAGKQGSPHLSEEVPYQITLFRLSQGGLDRRGEKVIWEMFTENDCNTFADLKR